MGRSLGNFITLDELFSGEHQMLEQAYTPMTIRFFILQAHYRSTLDFSNEALQGSEKGLARLLKALEELDSIQAEAFSSIDVELLVSRCENAMKDDLNTPLLLGHLFEGVKWIHGLKEGKLSVTKEDLQKLRSLYHIYIFKVLGLNQAESPGKSAQITDELVELILQLRTEAKAQRNFETADRIREDLGKLGITIKDRKDGADWEIN
jgi:cysteinyl-tRNA synthetase